MDMELKDNNQKFSKKDNRSDFSFKGLFNFINYIEGIINLYLVYN